MIYKIRAILDVEKDVIRDVLIDSTENLETLHNCISNAFGFNGQEMASYYRSDNDWNQGEEIPLFNMSDDTTEISMQNCTLDDTLPNEGDKLIYVYDFLSMWTFYIELSEIKENSDDTDLPKVIFAFGDVPETAPEKEFTSESDGDFDLGEDTFDNIDEFDNIDDYDF
jgi:hypothetical protein